MPEISGRLREEKSEPISQIDATSRADHNFDISRHDRDTRYAIDNTSAKARVMSIINAHNLRADGGGKVIFSDGGRFRHDMSEVEDEDRVIVEIDSNQDKDDEEDDMLHLTTVEKERYGGDEDIISSSPPVSSGVFRVHLASLQFRKLALQSFDLALALASGAGLFNLLCNRFEAVGIAVEAVIRRDGQKHLECFHVIPQSKLFFQVLKEGLVFREDDNRVLLFLLASRDGILGHFVVFVAGGLVVFVGVHVFVSPCSRRRGENGRIPPACQPPDERFPKFFS